MTEHIDHENENLGEPEEEPVVDVSARVAEFLAQVGKSPRLGIDLRNELKVMPRVRIVLDYTTLEHAKYLKSLLTSAPVGGSWDFAIRATERQMKEAANVFASGVRWIPVGE